MNDNSGQSPASAAEDPGRLGDEWWSAAPTMNHLKHCTAVLIHNYSSLCFIQRGKHKDKYSVAADRGGCGAGGGFGPILEQTTQALEQPHN